MLKSAKDLILQWVKEKRGTTAIEFALLSIPYMFLSIGIIELSIMYASASLMEGATGSAARLIRTGQVQQTTGDPLEMFEQAFCDYAQVLVDCNAITMEVVVLDGFSDFSNYPPQFDESGDLVSRGVNFGSVNDKILVRTAFRYNMMTPFIGPLLAGEDNSRLFMSTVVLQTEPYEFTGDD